MHNHPLGGEERCRGAGPSSRPSGKERGGAPGQEEASLLQFWGEENLRLEKEQRRKQWQRRASYGMWTNSSPRGRRLQLGATERRGSAAPIAAHLTDALCLFRWAYPQTVLSPVLEKEHDPRVITVSSGGTLVQKLNTNDLPSERTVFSGTMVSAQNKMLCSPRSVGNGGVACSQPWAACGEGQAAGGRPGLGGDTSGRQRTLGSSPVLALSLLNQKPLPTHMPLIRTSSSPAEDKLIEILEELAQRFK
ncbi:hypothetical protein HPG69_009770 [Diceros bicornis minor]|uniref:Uncharacterized protein n=1 Tax=Diceros bicornis minor TaxID=77932 RepID=A0A7J7EYJ0_DICBM|nr:hypothetical protein HPG69_009770 [Diceros bicornis minor]